MMNGKDMEILKGLLKKLSAVRITLGDAEQAMLDQLIQGYGSEVVAHRITPAVEPKVTPAPDEVVAHRIMPAVEPKVTPAPDEVVAHRVMPAVESKVTPAPDEVVAHQVAEKVTPGIVIYFDQELESYQIKS